MKSSDTSPERPRTFRGIQALRGIAALMVVLHHAAFIWVEHRTGFIWRNGAGGVDIFFVISGFVMAITSVGKECGLRAAGRFLERRVIRIVPLYWILTLLTLAKELILRRHQALGNHAAHTPLTHSYIARSFLLIPVPGQQLPLLGQGWTLSYEMFFYLLFAICLVSGRRMERTLTFILLPLGIVGFFQNDSWPALLVLISPLLLEFLAGLWLGSVVREGVRLDHGWLLALGCLCLLVLFAIPCSGMPAPRVFEWGIPAFTIVAAVVGAEQRLSKHWPRWLLFVGDSSYSLYLTHSLILLVIEWMLARTGFAGTGGHKPLTEMFFIALCALVCSIGGIGTYYCVEKPLVVAFRHLLPDRRHKIIREAHETAS